ncbi:thioredoxin family protein [Gimibacter soli]|uniref:Thioredoxin family protein n=1 Tax=Gimibacter soli TaxID=3024400 RepID=A0AAE9XUA7_9PROT|nr:thioredoxin family protein [Gimibacter soli]WCL52839.1 thioredoxin family protein [Gimibacter soli]
MIRFAPVLLSIAAFTLPALAAPEVGKLAPAFTGTDTTGATISLADLKGKPVILEWTNHECPYVKKHYEGENMQRLQAEFAEKGAVWLTVISSAPGTQGNVDAAAADKLTADRGASPAHVLLDEAGTIGRAYEARTTPHMFLIDEAGVLQYMGAIDDKPSANIKTLEGAHNYVEAAWDAVKAGKAADPASTKPYGCSVKYEG